jgi:hypothetical protein
MAKVGRPESYRPEFCELAIELGKLGKSYAQIGAAVGVARITLYEWMDRHPEFADAMKRARDLALAWWEDQAAAGIWEDREGARLNAQVWSRSMAARFPDDYREARKTELVGANGGPVQAQIVVQTGVPDPGSDLV